MLHEADIGSVVVRLRWLVEVLISSVLGEMQKNDSVKGMYRCVEVVDLFEDVVIREEEEDGKRVEKGLFFISPPLGRFCL